MKIREILETDIYIRKRKKPFSFDPEDDQVGSNSGAPGGWYSTGNINPEDPEEFVKRPHRTTITKDDAYLAYVKKIKKLKEGGYTNPFFPRVARVDIVQDPRGNERTRYKIERLFEPEQFDDDDIKKLTVSLLEFDSTVRPTLLWNRFCDTLDDAARTGDTSKIKNPQLAEAIKIIHELLKEHPGWNSDLHGGNIRVRKGAEGLEAVLMDPISDAGKSIPTDQDIKYGAPRTSREPELLDVQRARIKLGKEPPVEGGELYKILMVAGPKRREVGWIQATSPEDAIRRAETLKPKLSLYYLAAEKGPAT